MSLWRNSYWGGGTHFFHQVDCMQRLGARKANNGGDQNSTERKGIVSNDVGVVDKRRAPVECRSRADDGRRRDQKGQQRMKRQQPVRPPLGIPRRPPRVPTHCLAPPLHASPDRQPHSNFSLFFHLFLDLKGRNPPAFTCRQLWTQNKNQRHPRIGRSTSLASQFCFSYQTIYSYAGTTA